jgi:2,4-dienoyl-CoA reductase-like NADH-dependent reductase (Old Yellow Enzyme family)
VSAYPSLFAPGMIAGVELKNRIVQTPMGTGLIDMGKVTTREVAFQEERARGGVGLIITGAAVVHPTSRFPARIITEAWDPDGIPALRLRTDSVHRHGARIFGQLIHLGRESPGGQTDFVPMGPSPIPHERDPGVPHEMSVADIRVIVDGFGTSAANFKSGGYDGVEIHGAHGYLVSQFLSQESNRRSDAYGGSLERRLRILVEIVEEIRARCGDHYPLGVRLSGDDYLPGGLTIDQTRALARALQHAAPVDYVSLTTGLRSYYVKDTTFPEGFALELGALLKSDLEVPLIVAGRIRHPDLAEQALAAGQTDFVGIGRAQLADPEWVRKAQEGRAEQIRPCIGIVQDCRRAEGIIGCTIHARAGREEEWGPVNHASTKRRVVVAGGGPGGLEAARVAAESGHDVVVYERADAIGGQLRIAAAGPTRGELLDFVDYLERELRRLGVELRTGTEATRDAVLGDAPDLVVCAAGATPEAPDFAVSGGSRVANVWELLGGDVAEVPARAVVVDDGTGFWHGISAVEYLAERGAAVELLTPARGVGLTIPHESYGNVSRRLASHGVRVRVLARVTGIDGTTVSFADGFAGEPAQTTAELVVVRTRMRANDALIRELEGAGPALVTIGDASAPRRLNHAVLDANLAVNRFDQGLLGPAATALA